MGRVKNWLMEMEECCDVALHEALDLDHEVTLDQLVDMALCHANQTGVTLSREDAHNLMEERMTWMDEEMPAAWRDYG